MADRSTSAALAAVGCPALRWQFSLRGVFLFVTVCAFAAVAIGLFVRRCEVQERAVQAILARGGQVYFEHQFTRGRLGKVLDPRPSWLFPWIHEKYVRTVVFVDLQGLHVVNSDLELLAPLGSLQYLKLAQTSISDEGLRHVARLRQLRQLDLDGTAIGDAGLAHLARLRRLELLKADRTRVTQHGIRLLEQSIPSCRIDTGGPLLTAP